MKKVKNYENKKMKNKLDLNDDYKMVVTFIVVLLVIAVLIGILFFFNAKVVSKDYFQGDETTTTAKIEYDESQLTVSNIFNVKDSEYYVLLYDTKDETSAFLYDGLASSYLEIKMPLYTIDLSNAMNKKYYDKDGEENTNPKKASEVLVTKPTLMVIKDGKVSEYISEREKIVDKLSLK